MKDKSVKYSGELIGLLNGFNNKKTKKEPYIVESMHPEWEYEKRPIYGKKTAKKKSNMKNSGDFYWESVGKVHKNNKIENSTPW